MGISIQQVIDAKAHIGTPKNEAHPKTNKYWLDTVNGMIILNPELIAMYMEKSIEKIQLAKKQGKDILVVCEKKMFDKELEALAEKCGFHYLNTKVPAGFLTNFDTFSKRINSMNEMADFLKGDEFASLTKKEQSAYKRKLERTERIYKGVRKLTKSPDLIVAIDGAMMKGFVDEIQKAHKDSIVIASSNFNKWRDEDSLMIANMNSFGSINFIVSSLFA